MLRWLVRLLLLLLLAAGVTYWFAGRGAPPVIAVEQPARFIGQAGTLELTVEAPGGRLTSLVVALEQNGQTVPLFNLAGSLQEGTLTGADTGTITQTGPDTIHVSRPLGKQSVPALQQGAARVVVSASRPSFLDLRTLSSSAAKDLEVRL